MELLLLCIFLARPATLSTTQMLTMLRFAAHIVVSILMGLLYWRVGDDASVIYNNAGLLFFNQLFILFAAMMPTVVTCEYNKRKSLPSYIYISRSGADFWPTAQFLTIFPPKQFRWRERFLSGSI